MTSPLRAEVYFTNLKVFPTHLGDPRTPWPSATGSWG
jgi:hypothetical protein